MCILKCFVEKCDKRPEEKILPVTSSEEPEPEISGRKRLVSFNLDKNSVHLLSPKDSKKSVKSTTQHRMKGDTKPDFKTKLDLDAVSELLSSEHTSDTSSIRSDVSDLLSESHSITPVSTTVSTPLSAAASPHSVLSYPDSDIASVTKSEARQPWKPPTPCGSPPKSPSSPPQDPWAAVKTKAASHIPEYDAKSRKISLSEYNEHHALKESEESPTKIKAELAVAAFMRGASQLSKQDDISHLSQAGDSSVITDKTSAISGLPSEMLASSDVKCQKLTIETSRRTPDFIKGAPVDRDIISPITNVPSANCQYEDISDDEPVPKETGMSFYIIYCSLIMILHDIMRRTSWSKSFHAECCHLSV